METSFETDYTIGTDGHQPILKHHRFEFQSSTPWPVQTIKLSAHIVQWSQVGFVLVKEMIVRAEPASPGLGPRILPVPAVLLYTPFNMSVKSNRKSDYTERRTIVHSYLQAAGVWLP